MEKNIIDHEGFLFQFSNPEGHENSQGMRKKRFGLTGDHLLFYHLNLFFFGLHKLPLPTPHCLPIVRTKALKELDVFLFFESLFFVPERNISSNPIGRQLLCVCLSTFFYASCFCSSDLFTTNLQQQFPLNGGGHM